MDDVRPTLPALPEPEPEPSGQPAFAPYDAPAGGWGALHAAAKALREQSVLLKGSTALLSINQPGGFDCPGCAWPDPRHTSSFEYCENGAKAITLVGIARDDGFEVFSHPERIAGAQRSAVLMAAS